MQRWHTDLPLKKLFALRAAELLELTGDAGARVESSESVEIASTARRVDLALKLNGPAGVYLRHVEFQSDAPPDLARRCFEYNTRLHLHTSLPVLTTVVFVKPPGPRGRPVYEVRLGRRVLHRWRFEWVRLWELDARTALARGGLGLAILAPLMGAGRFEMVEHVGRRVLAEAPRQQRDDLLAALTVLAGVRYPAHKIGQMTWRRIMIESSAWEYLRDQFERRGMAKGLAKGEAAGITKGKLLGERKVCLALVRSFHPDLLLRARPVVEKCADVVRLEKWSVQASRLDGPAFARLLGLARTPTRRTATKARRVPASARAARRAKR